MNQKNKGAAIEKPLFVVQGCLEMVVDYWLFAKSLDYSILMLQINQWILCLILYLKDFVRDCVQIV